MANGFQGPPAVDFYSMLSGLGDTIAANRAAQAKRDAFAQATTPGPDGKIDYGRAILGLAQVDPAAANILASRQNHEDTLKQQGIESARNASNDTFNHGIATANLGIARANLANNSEGPEEVADQRAAAALKMGLKPGTPEHLSYTLTGQLPDAEKAGKPIPFETLGGTKFLVRGPNGSYTQVNPADLGSPGPPPPQPISVGPPGAAPSPTPLAASVPAGPDPAIPPGPSAPPAGPPAIPVAAQSAPDVAAVDPQTGRREAWLKSQPPDVQAYIKKIADYEIDPRTTSIKGGHREQVLSAVANYDPTYNQNEFGSRAKAIKDFSTGPQGNIIRSFDVAIDHLDTLQKAATAMKNGNMKLLNEVRNQWRTQTGSDLPTNFQALVPLVSGEIAKAVIGSNNALSDREELRTNLQKSNSPDQIAGVIGGYKGLMSGQLKGLRKQYEQTTGRKDFDSRLREHTLKELSASDKAAPVIIDGYTIKEN